jgi:hypothetical protein
LPGEYKVLVSRRLRRDGSAPDPNVPPSESGAVEALPTVYQDRNATPLRASVSKDARAHNFALQRRP